ncbi:MAG: ATP-binding protein [Verrucomicrobia bacterium]|nr:ATP-binding protein [Verrucomicrobiota bacterium]
MKFKLKSIIFPVWGYSFGILVFVLLVKFGFVSTESIGISVSSLEIVLIIYALVLGLIQVARQSLRLKKLSAIATDLGSGQLKKRSKDLNFDAIGNLAHAINKMADQIQGSMNGMKAAGESLEAQNDELHKVLKTEARFGAFLESIAKVDTYQLARTALCALRENTNAFASWLIYFDPETNQKLCYRSYPGEFGKVPDAPFSGNMHEIASSRRWNYGGLDRPVSGQEGNVALLIPIQFDSKPLGVVVLELESELDGREKRILGNYVEAFSNALSNSMSYLAALRQSIRLEELNKELSLADQNRSNFVARMSHELRTPLNSIIGFSKIMEKNKPRNLSELDLERLEKIHRNGNHLLHMINNILDLSKVEAGEMRVEAEMVDLDELTGDVIDMLQPQAAAKNLYLVKQFDESGLTTCTDSLKLRQVLVNLIGNAIKFTQVGGIKVVCELSEDDPQHLYLDVVDTGVGVEAEKHDRIFKAFSQGDSTTAQKFGGTGLGLTISRSIVQLLGGVLELKSVPSQGSVFRIKLPLRLKTNPKEMSSLLVKKQEENIGITP